MTPVISYQQGAIVVVHFPFTDVSRTQKRPALILSNATINQTGDYLMVQITSQVKPDGLSLPINPIDYISIPLPLTSFVRIHKVFLLNESLILSRFGAVVPTFHGSVVTRLMDFPR